MAYLLWNVVLAGGQGRRLSEITMGVPKQFWSPDGVHTMVEQTIGRVAGLVPASRTVTVLGPGQIRHLSRVQARDTLGLVLEQPTDRGTGIAILWGLSHVMAKEPDAIVMVTPADHGVSSTAEYRDGIRIAARAVSLGQEQLVLFGTTPDSPAQDYGWIVPGPAGDVADRRLFRPVCKFAEKPGKEDACRLMALGGLWNTMVLVGRATAIVDLFRENYAMIVEEASGATDSTPGEVSARFANWGTVDFSRDILSRAANLSSYAWRPSLGWCDLGTEDRLRQWQQREPWMPSPPRRPVTSEAGHSDRVQGARSVEVLR